MTTSLVPNGEDVVSDAPELKRQPEIRVSRSPLRIAIASGKGGTGKTTIATNFAVVLAESGTKTAYVDCDVEAPNGHIFFQPKITSSRDVTIPVPEVDETLCVACGLCSQVCRYAAIIALPKKVITFPQLCHGCGGCALVCPQTAIQEVPRATGIVELGKANDVSFVQGRLNIGETMAPPVIREVLDTSSDAETIIIDAPPGTACPAIESVKNADVVLLATEPTPFGLNDLKLAVAMVRALGIPFGVAINRVGIGDDAVSLYCKEQQIPVLLEIPDSRAVAQAYARGELAVHADADFRPLFAKLAETIGDAVCQRVETPVLVHGDDANAVPKVQSAKRSDTLREVVVISGKGGTGKTSIVAALCALAECALAEQVAVADCDVDAADLHLVLEPEILHRYPFSGGKTALVDVDKCTGCGDCIDYCRFDAIIAKSNAGAARVAVDLLSCEGCGVCVDHCPHNALTLVPTTNGEWFISKTRFGPMIHAKLGIAQENSGKLVSLVRRQARDLAQLEQRKLLICDGSPGIGCPVIASLTGADMALIVTEPTLSGRHDFKRVAQLCNQLNVNAAVCINKVDINPEIADEIAQDALELGMPLLGRVRYDSAVTEAQLQRCAIVEKGDSLAAADIRALWERLRDAIA